MSLTLGTRQAEIYRDRFGVPHVFAASLEEAYFGLGYCAGQDRPKTLPLHQFLLQGRLAECLGDRPLPLASFPLLDHLVDTPFFRGYADETFSRDTTLGVDRWMRHFAYYESACAALDEMSDRSRMIVDAFAAGVNYYFRTHASPSNYEEYQPATELAWWTWFEHTIAMGFFISNAFAVAPSKTATGSAWIAGDPHYWFMDGHSEAHLVCPGLDLSGLWDGHVNLGFWGGTNTYIAVHITAAGLEGATAYRERLNPHNREEYFDWRLNAYRPLDSKDHEIRVRSSETVTFVSRRTHHGPLVGEAMSDGAPIAYSIRSPVDANAGQRLDQSLGVWTQRSVRDFIAFTETAPFVRGHRLCIDRHGELGYVCNGLLPVRSEAIDWSQPVDGSTSETEWGETRWQPNARRFGLPSFTNPQCGFIQSANDPPWVATIPGLVRSDFPKYVFPDGWRALGPRGARQRELLHRDDQLTAKALEAIIFDVFVPRAYFGVTTLRAAFATRRATLPPLSAAAAHLDKLLASWDGRAQADSAAMTIAFYLNRVLPGGLPMPLITVTDRPATHPEIEATVQPGAGGRYGRALEAVAELLQETYGTLEKPWGEVHVMTRLGGDFGLPGGCNALRSLLGTWHGWWDVADQLDDDAVERCNFGSRVLRLTELGAGSVSVWSVSLTGQMPASEHPDSPHVLDQARLYQALKLKPFPLTRAQIRADARTEDHVSCNHPATETIEWTVTE